MITLEDSNGTIYNEMKAVYSLAGDVPGASSSPGDSTLYNGICNNWDFDATGFMSTQPNIVYDINSGSALVTEMVPISMPVYADTN